MCTFLLIVLPGLAIRAMWRGCCWLYTFFTGRKVQLWSSEPEKKEQVETESQAENAKRDTATAKKSRGFCPYTFVLGLFGIDARSKNGRNKEQNDDFETNSNSTRDSDTVRAH